MTKIDNFKSINIRPEYKNFQVDTFTKSAYHRHESQKIGDI